MTLRACPSLQVDVDDSRPPRLLLVPGILGLEHDRVPFEHRGTAVVTAAVLVRLCGRKARVSSRGTTYTPPRREGVGRDGNDPIENRPPTNHSRRFCPRSIGHHLTRRRFVLPHDRFPCAPVVSRHNTRRPPADPRVGAGKSCRCSDRSMHGRGRLLPVNTARKVAGLATGGTGGDLPSQHAARSTARLGVGNADTTTARTPAVAGLHEGGERETNRGLRSPRQPASGRASTRRGIAVEWHRRRCRADRVAGFVVVVSPVDSSVLADVPTCRRDVVFRRRTCRHPAVSGPRLSGARARTTAGSGDREPRYERRDPAPRSFSRLHRQQWWAAAHAPCNRSAEAREHAAEELGHPCYSSFSRSSPRRFRLVEVPLRCDLERLPISGARR